MSVNDILLQSGQQRLSNLVPIKNISARTASKYESLGYDTTLNSKTFQQQFPNIDVHKVYLSLGFPPRTIYYDKDTKVYCDLSIFQGRCLLTEDALLETIKNLEGYASQRYTREGLIIFLSSMPNVVALEIFKQILTEELNKYDENLYDVFCYFYFQADYGNGVFTKQDIPLLRSIWEISEVYEQKHFDGYITIYRGEGSASASYEEAISWTLDKNFANFFAVKNTEDNARIISAKIKADKISGYIEEEEEVLINPDEIIDVEIQEYYTLDLLKEVSNHNIFQIFLEFAEEIRYLEYPCGKHHGAMHAKRVLLYCVLLGYLLHLGEEDIRVLAKCALFHDIGRLNDDNDNQHGKAAYDEYFGSAIEETSTVEDNYLIKLLLICHCLSDSEGYSYIEEHVKSVNLQKKAKFMLDIFKDCDALDRNRFGILALDVNQLRNPQTILLSLIAQLTLNNLE